MNKLKISIIGSGWLGSALAKDLSLLIKEVKVSSRNKNDNIDLKNKNIKQYIIDIDKLEYKKNDFFDCDILIINIPSKNISSFRYLIEEINKNDLLKVIFISSTSIYDDINTIIYEDDNNENKSKELYIIEKMFFDNDKFLTTSLRLSGLIGYSRHPGKFFKNKIVKNCNASVNLIHRDDCVNIIIEIIKQDIWNEKFNCSASTHPSRKDFYTFASSNLDNNLIFEQKSPAKYKIISNKKIINMLNYDFIYPDLMKINF